MKKRLLKFVGFACMALLLMPCLVGCKDKDGQQDVKEELPPYTETGANTFGCTINGRNFIPKGGYMFPKIMCSYVYVGGRYQFSLGATTLADDESESVIIIMDTARLKQDSTYTLGWEYETKNSGKYKYGHNSVAFPRLPYYNGEIYIKHFDTLAGIVSGTFWMDAMDTVTGNVLAIRDGRFDVPVRR